jgi:hypothetical protein
MTGRRDIDWSSFSAEEKEMLQTIHLSVCAELEIPLSDDATRDAVAEAIIASAADGNRDVPVITEAARVAALSRAAGS